VSEYGPWLRGPRIAAVYDEWCTSVEGLDTEGAVAFLTELAATGPVLELAIGTGRLAVPLAERGLRVHGIDISAEMLATLREKPGGELLEVTVGDMADVDVDGRFRLIFVSFNTFFALPSQDDQVRCFANVARHLTPEGVFVIEAFVPDLRRFALDGPTSTQRIELEDATLVDVATHHPSAQRVESRHIVLREEGMDVVEVSTRYAYPAELDLMARVAGMSLRERWSGWRREPFTDASKNHVSVYELSPVAGS
jgi:SAM-dependent methyltransferase